MMKKNVIFLLFFLFNFNTIDLIAVAKSLVIFKAASVTPPKCGTHLLLLALKLVEGKIKDHLTPQKLYLINDLIMTIFLRTNVFLSSHAIHNEINIQQLNRSNIKTFFIYRDPRDQIVSAAFMIKNLKLPIYSEWDLNSIIDELISGGGAIWELVFKSKEPWSYLNGIAEFYDLYLPWQYEPNVYTTTFEKLVGPKGGGTEEEQLHEIIAIAHHMGKQINQNEALTIAKKLFGGTTTFREGKIGSWKKYFLERHKIAFKTAHNGAGQKLLERLGYEKDDTW